MADANDLIRIGKVSSIDANNKKARVYYPARSNMVSDWLPVLQFPGLTTNYSGGHKHTCPDGETNSAGSHSHTSLSWMPKVNDKVLVIMEPGFNAPGYIAGVIP